MRPHILRLGFIAAAITIAAPTAAIRPEDITDHLEMTIAWYRHVQTVDQASSDILLRQSVHQSSLKALQLGFDFARAAAGLVTPEAQTQNPGNGPGNLQQAASKAADRVANLQSRLAETDAEMTKAPARQRAQLQAQRKEIVAELDLAKEIQNTIQTLVNFSGNLGSGANTGLSAQIDELERSVPEARHEKTNTATSAAAPQANTPAPPTPNPPTSTPPESRGLVGLISDLFSVQSRRTQFTDLRKETDALVADVDRLRAPLLSEIRAATRRADEIGSASGTQNTGDPNATQNELNALSSRFKHVSKALVPLSEQAITLASTRGYLQESIDDLSEQFGKIGRYLLLRAIMLALAIGVILVFSEVWRRATFRYVSDLRRRRQFLMMRRIIVACAVFFVVLIGFVTEFGSLATYAGFVTAGLAVALQNPILSVVAYFFLIGRYGIRVGDRVTISGVTGEVIEIGLVRIYLIELGPDLRSTGRVVVFSNAVIFQPAALYKQMPGLDYVWHTVTLTLSGDSDAQLAESTLKAAADAVYQQYGERIARQHRSFEQSIDVDVSAPRPDTRLRYTDAGLEFVVRYPAELKQAATTDDRMMRALYDAIDKEPKLKFAPAGRPRVQLAA